MRCPNCGASELTVKLLLAGTADLRFDGDVTVVSTDEFESEVPDVAECQCNSCEWEGMACETRPTDDRKSVGALSDEDLRRLVSALSTAALSDQYRSEIEAAMTELMLLRRLCESRGNNDAADTVIM